ncbi:anthranilate phosphoribosyltransferase [Candidatus Gottesmanbacteria bacterium]|nr:anthranilate phosphoribosyltransferase [Candidatus Gottesmanbacteria bacterium]
MINILLNKLIETKDLTQEEAICLMEEILEGNLTSAQIAAILVALRMKEEIPEEILGFIKVMRKHMVKIKTKGLVIDTCGTGGDGKGTFNISTAVAFVIVGAGVSVAKHGNRNASSACGSADVLEALGVNINLTPKEAEKMLSKTKFTFLFAPLYHPAMRHVGEVRKELKIRTVFNFLGPFASPASVRRQIIGVPNIKLAGKLAKVASNLNYDHLLLVTSEDGLDEISLSSPTHIFEVKGKQVKKMIINGKDYGFEKSSLVEIKGGDAKRNAEIIKDIMKGKNGPCKDIIVLNSAVGLYVAGKVKNIGEGLKFAQKSIEEGNAKKVLAMVIKYSRYL